MGPKASGRKIEADAAPHGVGVHHAGLLAKYRRVVRSFRKEAPVRRALPPKRGAGINSRPASVVLTSLVQRVRRKEKMIDRAPSTRSSAAPGRPTIRHQATSTLPRGGRRAHLLGGSSSYDQIPEDTQKTPAVMKKTKELQRKKPKRTRKRSTGPKAEVER